MPSWKQALTLAQYQLRDYVFSRRFILMMALVAIIGAILTAVVGYFRPAAFLESSGAFYAIFWGGGVTVVIVFAGVIFGGDAIAGEFQNKTGYFLMGQPIRRATVYVGKYLAAFVAAFTAVVFFAVLLLGNGAYYFGAGAFTATFLASFVLAIVYLLALLGATFLFSSLFKTSTYATLVVAVLFLFGFMLIQDLISGLVHTTPWYILTYADSIIGGIFNTSCASSPGTHTCTMPGPGGGFTQTVTNATIPEGVGIMLAYFVITSVLGLVSFEREEFS
ncbi:MAG: ABC transporter permease [Thermoplasmata archaeon]|nr:ABC transporter permease [Thermoplasmata archaeon]MCI4337761.1 ABC transporter permease [Thermoplasmata archaeon]MCI4341391.1 ABC transporter permease [Thermoplasmata archaeon]